MERTTHCMRVLRVRENGIVEEPVPILMRNTLFGALWDEDKACLLRVDRPRGEDQLGLEASRMKLTSQLQQLPDGLKVLGAGNGLKSGKVWAAVKRVVQWCRERWFGTAELSYARFAFK